MDTEQLWVRTGLDLVYEQGGRVWHQEIPATLIVCGSAVPEEDCTQEAAG